MFWPNSTATMPTVSAVVPVITPADRSKCPPIMSSATATAMIPSVEAGSSQLATPARGAEDRRLDGEEREDDDGADQRPELRA